MCVAPLLQCRVNNPTIPIMTDSRVPFLDVLARQLELLGERRQALIDEILEIDRKLASIAKTMGVDVSEVRADPVGPPLPKRSVDPRSEGTMPQFLRDFLSKADRGYTRKELKEVLRNADPKFAASLNRNENGFYNAVKRLIGSNQALEIEGVIYDAARAPRDQEPQLFGGNVTLLKTAADQ
jgi:hypothetical protein